MMIVNPWKLKDIYLMDTDDESDNDFESVRDSDIETGFRHRFRHKRCNLNNAAKKLDHLWQISAGSGSSQPSLRDHVSLRYNFANERQN